MGSSVRLDAVVAKISISSTTGNRIPVIMPSSPWPSHVTERATRLVLVTRQTEAGCWGVQLPPHPNTEPPFCKQLKTSRILWLTMFTARHNTKLGAALCQYGAWAGLNSPPPPSGYLRLQKTWQYLVDKSWVENIAEIGNGTRDTSRYKSAEWGRRYLSCLLLESSRDKGPCAVRNSVHFAYLNNSPRYIKQKSAALRDVSWKTLSHWAQYGNYTANFPRFA
jgi:hypothetical protein